MAEQFLQDKYENFFQHQYDDITITTFTRQEMKDRLNTQLSFWNDCWMGINIPQEFKTHVKQRAVHALQGINARRGLYNFTQDEVDIGDYVLMM